MLAIDLVSHLGRLPLVVLVVLVGLALMASGGVLDVAVHFGPVSHHAREHGGFEHVAHLVGIAGMVLVLAGVVIHGARHHRRDGATQHGGLDPNAPR